MVRSWLDRLSFMGWRMVLVAFFVDFIAVGFFFYSYGVFFKAIAVEFGDSRLGVSVGITIIQVVSAVMAPFIGRALDYYSLKRIILTGAFTMGIGFLLLSQVRSPIEFYIVLALFIGFGLGAMGQIATSKLISNWFVRRRGAALGIAATGISASGVVMPVVGAWIISNYGWREGFTFYGLFTLLIVVPVVLRFIVSTPEEVGLHPDGETEVRRLPQPQPQLHSREILRMPDFWILVVTIGLVLSCVSATLVHMIPKVTDRGFDLVAASFIASITAGTGILGKVVFGTLTDRWDIRHVWWFCIAVQVAGQLLMFSDSYLVFLAGACIFGFGAGGMVPMQAATIAHVFGRESLGRAMGALRPPMATLHVIGVPLAGWMYDVTGSYDLAFQILLGFYVLAAIVIGRISVRRGQPAPDPKDVEEVESDVMQP